MDEQNFNLRVSRLEGLMEKVVVVLEGHSNQIGGLIEVNRLTSDAARDLTSTVGELKTAQLETTEKLDAVIKMFDEWVRRQPPPQN